MWSTKLSSEAIEEKTQKINKSWKVEKVHRSQKARRVKISKKNPKKFEKVRDH